MFEYGPDGRRRLTQFGQRVITAMAIAGMVLAATAWIATHVRSGDGAVSGGIVAGGFALAGTLFMQILNYGQGRKNEDILHYQNEKLEKIEGKVDGETAAAVTAVRAEWQRDRHDLKGELQAKQLKAELAEAELKAAESQNAKLEAQVHDLTERLARCAESKGQGDKPC
jgi:hypothetical protein